MPSSLPMYFFHVNLGIALFYAFYRLLYTRDTFFITRRAVLILSVLGALLLPLPELAERFAMVVACPLQRIIIVLLFCRNLA